MAIEDELRAKLTSKKSPDRRSAAKKIRKLGLTALGSDLLTAYEKERFDKRTWETQVEMLTSLGALRYLPSLPAVEEIVQRDAPRDMITFAAGGAYVRLKRTGVNDASPVIQLLAKGGFSSLSGALISLSEDRMVPSRGEMETILEMTWDLHRHPDRDPNGHMDPLHYVAIACAGWPEEVRSKFFEHCLQTGGSLLGRVIESSSRNKYSY